MEYYLPGKIEVRATAPPNYRRGSVGLYVIYKPYNGAVDNWEFLRQQLEVQSEVTNGIIKSDGRTFKFVNVPITEADPPPVISIGVQEAQQLMDDLWQCGLRPSEGTGSAGAMAAVQQHLADMRRLVFDTPGKVISPPGPITYERK